MHRLPSEILQHILWYIDQPLDLFRISCVCSRWRSFIINDEYFLNQWFSRSLQRSKQSFSFAFNCYSTDCNSPWRSHIYESLFPIYLRSSYYDFLPWTRSEHSCDYDALFEHGYSLSLFESSHSFSFWLFLHRQCELNIQIGNFNVNGVTIVLSADTIYYSDKKKRISVAHRWIHMVLTKTNSQRYYQIWIDGEHVSKLNQFYLYFSKMEKYDCYINMILHQKSNTNSLEVSDRVRIADLNAFKRCLTLVEIQAIRQQQDIKQKSHLFLVSFHFFFRASCIYNITDLLFSPTILNF